MKVLYYTTYDEGLGADRWIALGYADAFRELGCDFQTTESERFDLSRRLLETNPDIFFVPAEGIERAPRGILGILEQLCRRGLKVFFFVDEYFKDHLDVIQAMEERRLVHSYYSYYVPESMQEFEAHFRKPYRMIPLAANHRLHFPAGAEERYRADISFIGNRLPTKEAVFQKLLFPLMKKYRVRVYGPNWTLKDKALRLISGLGRKSQFLSLADWANRQRLTVPLEEERKVYASSAICINIHEYYPDGRPKNFSNEREFKIPASGGFQISDYVRGLERFFAPGKEIVVARTNEEWFEKIEYYLRHPPERKIIQERGTERALREHTYLNRARLVLALAARSSSRRP